MTYHEHRTKAKKELKFGILTVSTSRYGAGRPEDLAGDLAKQLIKTKKHKVVRRAIVPDSIIKIRKKVLEILEDVDVLVITGGTGASKTDVTLEAIKPIWDKEMPGFGEAFRMEGYKRIGSPALLSRAAMGVLGGKIILCLPGSPDGVKLGLEIIMDELPHLKFVLEENT